jgi:hypothetical protein
MALIHFAQSQNIALQITNIKALLLQATSWMAAGFCCDVLLDPHVAMYPPAK